MPLPIATHNGILLGYKLKCIAQNGHSTTLEVTDAGANVHDLQANTHYTCLVCGYTSVGCGPEAVIHVSTYDHCK